MNDIFRDRNIRAKTLLVVEGFHEKEVLLKSLLRAFKSIGVDYDNTLIYETNVFELINLIESEYGEKWELEDIDLPLLLSRKKEYSEVIFKRYFTDIFLIFDYERQDPFFSGEKLEKLQIAFDDSADNGKLYMNYPMVESYMDYKCLPDDEFETRAFRADFSKGSAYKSTVKDSLVLRMVELPFKIIDILRGEGVDYENAQKCMENITSIDKNKCTVEYIHKLIMECCGENVEYISNLIRAKVLEVLSENETYDVQLRKMFEYIILSNYYKIKSITNSNITDCMGNYQYHIARDFLNLLKEQNRLSSNRSEGLIWVVNTSVLLVPDYNSNLIDWNRNHT